MPQTCTLPTADHISVCTKAFSTSNDFVNVPSFESIYQFVWKSSLNFHSRTAHKERKTQTPTSPFHIQNPTSDTGKIDEKCHLKIPEEVCIAPHMLGQSMGACFMPSNANFTIPSQGFPKDEPQPVEMKSNSDAAKDALTVFGILEEDPLPLLGDWDPDYFQTFDFASQCPTNIEADILFPVVEEHFSFSDYTNNLFNDS